MRISGTDGIGGFLALVKGGPRRACTGSVACMRAKLLQSCPVLCNTMDCSPPGCSVRGILQERILEWVAMPAAR